MMVTTPIEMGLILVWVIGAVTATLAIVLAKTNMTAVEIVLCAFHWPMVTLIFIFDDVS